MALSIIKPLFINFRGADCRFTFLSYLCGALRRHDCIQLLIDENFKRGNYITSEIIRAIKQSTISIAIISEDYAGSDVCLDELVMMLQRQETEGNCYMLLPIFYHVNKKEVEKQTGCFGDALVEMKATYGGQKVDEWRTALTKVAALSGRQVLPDENENIICNAIVDDVLMHVEWLNNKGIEFQADKDIRNEAFLGRSRKLKGKEQELLDEERKANPNDNFDSEEFKEWVTSKGNMAQNQSIKIGSSRSQIIMSPTSKQRDCEQSIVEALLKLRAFFSQDLTHENQDSEHLSDSLKVLEGLNEADGLTKVEKIQLSNLEQDIAKIFAHIRRNVKTMEEIDEASKRYDHEAEKVRELSEERKKMDTVLMKLDSQMKVLKLESTDIERKREEITQQRRRLIGLLNLQVAELKKFEDIDLEKQKIEVEELEQAACEDLDKIAITIDLLISKFTTTP